MTSSHGLSGLSVILLAWSTLVVAAQPTVPLFGSHQESAYGCEIQFTASFEDDDVDYEPLDLGDTALNGAGGPIAHASNKSIVRAKVNRVTAFGGVGEFGQPGYVPDFLSFSWEVSVSPATWEFIWGSIVYSLSYAGRSTFHGQFLDLLATRRRGQEMVSVGANGVFGQRTLPYIRPPDVIRSGEPVTFHLWAAAQIGRGSLTLREIGRPAHIRTVPYTVRPGSEECTVVAL